jgi:hypothetical protein
MPGGGVSQLEQELRGLIGPDIRSMTVYHRCYPFSTFSSLIFCRDGNTQNDGLSTPLRVPLTGSRLFTTSWILGLGIPKAIYANRGQSPFHRQWIGWEGYSLPFCKL